MSAETIQSCYYPVILSLVSLVCVCGGGVTELEEETKVHVGTREIRQAEMGSGTQMPEEKCKKEKSLRQLNGEKRGKTMACVIQQSYCPYLLNLHALLERSARGHFSRTCVKESALLCHQMTHYKGRDRVVCMDCGCIVWSFVCVSAESIQPC